MCLNQEEKENYVGGCYGKLLLIWDTARLLFSLDTNKMENDSLKIYFIFWDDMGLDLHKRSEPGQP